MGTPADATSGQPRVEPGQRASTRQEVNAWLRSRPDGAAPMTEWIAFFRRKEALFERLAAHYADHNPVQAAECRDLATKAARRAERLSNLVRVAAPGGAR